MQWKLDYEYFKVAFSRQCWQQKELTAQGNSTIGDTNFNCLCF
jgi:hypothetical protein